APKSGPTGNTSASTPKTEHCSKSSTTRRKTNEPATLLSQRQPRLRNRLDTRTQHWLGVLRHSCHHINDLPLLDTTPSHHDHRSNHVGISTLTTQTRHT